MWWILVWAANVWTLLAGFDILLMAQVAICEAIIGALVLLGTAFYHGRLQLIDVDMMSVILEANSSLMTMTSWALLTALIGVSALLIALFGMSALLIALFGMSAPLFILSGMLAAPIFAVIRMSASLFSLSGKTAPLFTLSRMMATPFFLQPVMSMGPLIALVGIPILFLTVMNTRFFWNP